MKSVSRVKWQDKFVWINALGKAIQFSFQLLVNSEMESSPVEGKSAVYAKINLGSWLNAVFVQSEHKLS